jgi:hypothetical protein
MSAVPHPVAALPFVADRTGPVDKDRSPRCFWSVKPTGAYGADNQTGYAFALAYLRYLRSEGSQGPGHLPSIVGDMPRGKLTGIEVGFLVDHRSRRRSRIAGSRAACRVLGAVPRRRRGGKAGEGREAGGSSQAARAGQSSEHGHLTRPRPTAPLQPRSAANRGGGFR